MRRKKDDTKRQTIHNQLCFVLWPSGEKRKKHFEKKKNATKSKRKWKIEQKLTKNAMGGRRQPVRFRGTKLPQLLRKMASRTHNIKGDKAEIMIYRVSRSFESLEKLKTRFCFVLGSFFLFDNCYACETKCTFYRSNCDFLMSLRICF